MLGELQAESKRQDRSISWLIQQSWKLARSELKKIPSTSDYIPDDPEPVGERADEEDER
jgi:uncharacterized small protein (TIGR04563 family)